MEETDAHLTFLNNKNSPVHSCSVTEKTLINTVWGGKRRFWEKWTLAGFCEHSLGFL